MRGKRREQREQGAHRRLAPPRPAPAATPDPDTETSGDLDRLIPLSDGVFAFAMTLLVVDLTVPEIASGDVAAELPARLWALWPKALTYVISFLVAAIYWTNHRRMFRSIVRADGMLTSLNVLLLMLVAFQPFPTAVLGAYGDQPVAVMLYAGTLALTGLTGLAIWLYASGRRRLLHPDASARLIRYQTWRAVGNPLVFLVSIGIATLSPLAAELSWLGVAVILVLSLPIFRDVV